MTDNTSMSSAKRASISAQEILDRFTELCVPVEDKINYLLARYAHLGAFFQQGKELPDSEPDETASLLSASMLWARTPYDAGVVIPARSKAKKLIISHIDLVPNFEAGFAKGQTFVIEPYFDDVSVVKGGLDNGITNAALCAVLDKEGGIPEDVEILFSLGEESGSTGVEEYMQHQPQEFFEDLFVINLDVSNEFFGTAAISIEFDYMDPVLCDQIAECVAGVDFTPDRFCDDTDMVLGYTDAAFSFCLPTAEYCHTYDSQAILELLPVYCEGLRTLMFDFEINYDQARADQYYRQQLELQKLKPANPCVFRSPK